MNSSASKTKKSAILFLWIIAIALFWCIERVKIIPQYGNVFYELGLQCEGECKKDKKLRYFKEAVHHNPNLGDGYRQLGFIYGAFGDQARSLESFIKATELNYQDTLSYYKVGLYYFHNGAYEKALRYFLQSYRQGNCPDDTNYFLALIYDQRKEYVPAIGYYAALLELRSEYATEEVCSRLAELYYFLNNDYYCLYRIKSFRKLGKNDLADRLERAYKAVQVSGISNKEEGGK